MLPHDPRFEGIDRMTGSEFEAFLGGLFAGLGHAVIWNGGYDDKGVDLIVEIDGVLTAVQAKRWHSSVGIDCVNTLYAGKARYDCGHGIVVTTSYFTTQATAAAAELGVELWDRRTLGTFLKGDAPRIDPGICAECGKPVSSGVAKFCEDQPGRFHGRVYCPHHQRKQNRAA
jgi:HJR/Mrr/RecB family endonuclease